MSRSCVLIFVGLVVGSMTLHASPLPATEPLHQQVDALIESHPDFRAPAAARTDDASFLRRIHLDLAGSIPSATEVREFLADQSPDKRAKRIDKLLESPQYARRMQHVFDVMLMERRPSIHIKVQPWQDYLRESFLQNKSWLDLSQEILTADGVDEQTRPAARFLLDRELKIDSVTRDVGRLFLGRDLECAQCHDHPAIDDYLQRHYYGIAAFINRSYIFKDPKTKQSLIGEKAEGEIEFTSVFTDEKDETSPRILDAPPISDPPNGDELYKIKPEKNVRSVPIYSRRLQLAKSITDPSNQSFRLNIANRIWAMMMGRGLVEPLDMWHEDNPPSHNELLDRLADSLLQHDYDLKYLIRELALSKTYQRSSQSHPPVSLDPGQTTDFSVALLKPLSPEQLAWSMMQATGLVDQQVATLVAKQRKADDPQLADDPVWQENALNTALRSNTEIFAKVFGHEGVRNDGFDASADQALFLRNGDLLQRWVTLKNGLSDRLTALDNDQVAEEFYLSIFSRLPTAEEAQPIVDLLDQSKQRKIDLQHLVWAGLTSSAFRFNH